jgi:hypothetical protein
MSRRRTSAFDRVGDELGALLLEKSDLLVFEDDLGREDAHADAGFGWFSSTNREIVRKKKRGGKVQGSGRKTMMS